VCVCSGRIHSHLGRASVARWFLSFSPKKNASDKYLEIVNVDLFLIFFDHFPITFEYYTAYAVETAQESLHLCVGFLDVTSHAVFPTKITYAPFVSQRDPRVNVLYLMGTQSTFLRTLSENYFFSNFLHF
jgi:hypothetical protein